MSNELVAYQLGFLRGKGYTDAQIDRFVGLMTTEPTVRPEPRYGDPTDYDFDYPAEGPAGYGRAPISAAPVSGTDKAASC